jgi:putative endopeptidase
MKKEMLLLSASAVLLFSCSNNEQKSETTNNQTSEEVVPGFDLSNLDTTYNPCEDFYHYAIGGWLKKNPVPETESRWSSFSILAENNRKKLKGILEEAAANPGEKGSEKQLVGDFYKVALDSNKAEKLGYEPIKPLLDEITAIKEFTQIPAVLAKLKHVGTGGLFRFGVGNDMKKSDQYITYLLQGGLGLPDKDYYFNEKYADVKEKYLKHIQQVFTLIGYKGDEAQKAAQDVLNFETKLAKASRDRVLLRDPSKNYNKISKEELISKYPNLDFPILFEEFNISDKLDSLVIGQPEFIETVNTLIEKENVETIKNYLKWNVANNYSEFLSSDFVLEDFDFYQRTLRGIDKIKPRWKRALETVDANLGEPLGKLFVEKYFSEESKEYVSNMVEDIREVFKERIQQLDWMSDATKEKALEKLSTFTKKIGYPDKWRDYSGLKISAEKSFADNIMACNKFNTDYEMQKLGKPVDRTEWGMSPHTVNAYYSALNNEIVFPAGILQPPFYNPNADDAINYGGIGTVIGHEFTHGFDDKGSMFDAKGNMKNWWTDEDRAEFEKRIQVIIDQFNAFEPLEGIHVNGELTIGENIADLGGLILGYYALQKKIQKDGKEPEPIDGFTYKQRFFLSWAQVWAININEEELKRLIATNPHAPNQYRVNGPLANLEEFREAWGCKPGDPMVRTDSLQAKVW